jgi:hypothetical protein
LEGGLPDFFLVVVERRSLLSAKCTCDFPSLGAELSETSIGSTSVTPFESVCVSGAKTGTTDGLEHDDSQERDAG